MKQFLILTTLLLKGFFIHAMEMKKVTQNDSSSGSDNALAACTSILEKATNRGKHSITTKQKLFNILRSCSVTEQREIYQNQPESVIGEIAAISLMEVGKAALYHRLADQLRNLTTEQMINIYRQSNQTKFAFANHQSSVELFKSSSYDDERDRHMFFSGNNAIIFNNQNGVEISRRPFPCNLEGKFFFQKDIFITNISPSQTWLLVQNKEKTKTWRYEVTQEVVKELVSERFPRAINDNGDVFYSPTQQGFFQFFSLNKNGLVLFCQGDQISIACPKLSAVNQLELNPKKIHGLSWTADNLILVVADKGGLYDPKRMTQLLPLHDSLSASYQPEENIVAMSKKSETLLWDIRCAHVSLRFVEDGSPLRFPDITLSKDCRSLATHSYLKNLKIFDLRKPDIEEAIITTMDANKLAALSLAAAQRQQQQLFPDESICPESLQGSYRDIVKLMEPVEQKKSAKSLDTNLMRVERMGAD